jgi:hypothetical protein
LRRQPFTEANPQPIPSVNRKVGTVCTAVVKDTGIATATNSGKMLVKAVSRSLRQITRIRKPVTFRRPIPQGMNNNRLITS